MKILRTLLVGIFLLASGIFSIQGNLIPKAQAATDTVTLSGTVLESMTFSITAGDPAAFGDITPATPNCIATGVVASVTTNAANGYTLGFKDDIAASNSSMVHTDTTTYIADYAGTVATPTTWSGNGLGTGLYAADTNKEAKWGAGTTVCDANNKYAGFPQNNDTTAHVVTGYHATADTSSWSLKVNVPTTQKTGVYGGTVTFTALGVLS